MSIFNLLRQILRHPGNRSRPVSAIFRFFGWQAWKRLTRRSLIVSVGERRKFLVMPDSHFSSQVLYTGLPEWNEMKFLLRFLRPDDCFLDLGANVGFYTVLASTITERIISVEANPDNVAILRQQIELNGLTEVTVVDRAVGDIDGPIHFAADHREVGTIVEADATSFEVPCQKLDTLLPTLLPEGRPVMLAKMDVEGCEKLILDGASECLRNRRIVTWLFEISDDSLQRHGSSHGDLLATFTNAGYSLFSWSEADHELTPVRDLNHHLLYLIATCDPEGLRSRLGLIGEDSSS